MKVTINETDYWVKWLHHVDQGCTQCVIEKKGFKQISVGNAFKSENDKYVKDKGRKVSLHRALVKLWPDVPEINKLLKFKQLREDEINFEQLYFNKQCRKIFWQAYFNRK